MKFIFMSLIKFYRKFISPLTPPNASIILLAVVMPLKLSKNSGLSEVLPFRCMAYSPL